MKKWVILLIVVLLSFVTNGTSYADLNDGLVAYYPFNGNANDDSGNGFDGVLVGGITLAPDRYGAPNSAYRFHSGYIDVNRGNPLNNVGSDPFSISAWFKIENNYQYGQIVHLGSGDSFQLYNHIPPHNIRVTLEGGGDANPFTILQNPELNIWYHVATVIQDQEMKIYLNGNYLGNNSEIYDLKSTGWNDYFRIGAQTDHSINIFPGVIDDIRIYNRALSDYEIKQLATGSTTSYSPDEVMISVFNSVTGESISGAVVTINSESGISDGVGNVTFESLSAGEYALSIQADGYSTFSSYITVQANGDMSLSYGDMSLSYGLTPGAGGDAPVVTDVVSSYSSRSEEAFFLYGTSFPLSFTANIHWNGKTPSSVQFITSTETYVQTIASDEDLTITLDVGRVFDPGGRLSVVAMAADGTVSAPFDANIEVMSQIFGTEVLQMPIQQQNGTFSYNREVELGATIFKPGEETDHPVPEEIPFFGGKEPKFVPKITFDVSIEKNIAIYTVKTDIDNKDKEMEILGQKVEAEMAVGGQLIFQYEPDNDTWTFKDAGILLEPSLSADFIKTPPYYYFLPHSSRPDSDLLSRGTWRIHRWFCQYPGF